MSSQNWSIVFDEMKRLLDAEGMAAIRSQRYIQKLHNAIALDLKSRLTRSAIADGVQVIEEAKIHGSFKDKDVDIAVVHPINGPLITCGVRSQMTSIGKNILTYSQDIMGEAISLQDRFPMSVFGYCYLLPYQPSDSDSTIDIYRYSKIFGSMAGRSDVNYKSEKGKYDHFAFACVDFNSTPPILKEDLISAANPKIDLSLTTLVDRMTSSFSERNYWLDYFN